MNFMKRIVKKSCMFPKVLNFKELIFSKECSKPISYS